jgi:hypothetical protein
MAPGWSLNVIVPSGAIVQLSASRGFTASWSNAS